MGEHKANIAATLPLFPILNQPPLPSLRGIARSAATAPATGQGHLVEFHNLPVRSILNRSVSRRGFSFAWSINPYRGCEFGCRYCYARYTHEYLELRGPDDFERKIYIKQDTAWLLRQELNRVPVGQGIAIGTATDPYQPIERRAKVTRSLLEVLALRRGLRIGVVTKSPLIERDIPLLQRIAAGNTLALHLTITTADAGLARILEPRAPRPDLRLRTVWRLRQAGLRTGILCSPLLPGLTDTAKALERMVEKAKEADASFFDAHPLFLKPCSKEIYLDFIREHFPGLEEMYRQRFSGGAFVSSVYAKRIQLLVDAARKRHGLGQRGSDGVLDRQEENRIFSEQPLLFPGRPP